MAIGERTPLASVNAPASGRMAIGEALTNLAAANIRDMAEVKLSANWMAAAGHDGDDAALYETVKAVGMELCPDLGIAIPVGKDSMSMKTVWQNERHETKSVTSPVSCIISAFAPVVDTNKTLTPVLSSFLSDTAADLFLIDLSGGQERLACSILAQVYNQVGTDTPDVDDAQLLKHGFLAIQKMVEQGVLTAYHDRSDGGLIVSALEMAFASRCGLELDLSGQDELATLFNEELGAIVEVPHNKREIFEGILTEFKLNEHAQNIGRATEGEDIAIKVNGRSMINGSRTEFHRLWSQTTHHMQSLRDNPDCAQQEYDRILDTSDGGLYSKLSFDPKEDVTAPYIGGVKPKVAVLREQGVNGQIEMAAAFNQAGFTAIDVTMTDIIAGRVSLEEFQGLVACGGFSFGDVLGAGEGWAKSIMFNTRVRDEFQTYFNRSDAFSLGICNGCQMMSNLKEIIPGAESWPHFVRNASEQFEARLVQSKVSDDTNSIFLSGMQGSQMPVVVAHGEGRAEYSAEVREASIALSYVDHAGEATQAYPLNPNGSPQGIAGLCNEDGRVTIMMPHPERIFRSATNSWRDASWGEYSPWMRMFRNARVWVS